MYDQNLVKVKDTNAVTNENIVSRPVKSKHLKRKKKGSKTSKSKLTEVKLKWLRYMVERERESNAIKTTTSKLSRTGIRPNTVILVCLSRLFNSQRFQLASYCRGEAFSPCP